MGAALLRAEPVIAVKRANRNFFITVPVSVFCVWYLVFNKTNKNLVSKLLWSGLCLQLSLPLALLLITY